MTALVAVTVLVAIPMIARHCTHRDPSPLERALRNHRIPITWKYEH